MFKRYFQCIAIAVIALTTIYPQSSFADQFKSSDFLKWKRENQSFYIDATIGAAGLISHINNKTHALCVERWYFGNRKKAELRIRKSMSLYPNDHPRAIIMGLLQKECGSFNYSEH